MFSGNTHFLSVKQFVEACSKYKHLKMYEMREIVP